MTTIGVLGAPRAAALAKLAGGVMAKPDLTGLAVFALVLVLCGVSSRSLAQGNPPTPSPPPAVAPIPPAGSTVGGAPAAPGGAPAAAAMPAVGPTGGRVGFAEVSVVAGNIASARERALTEALKQAVDQAIAVLIPDSRTTQPKLFLQVLGRARNYVKRYRTLEEGDRGRGLYGVRLEAEIDEPALLRAFDKPPAGSPAVGAPASASTPAYLLVGAGAPEAADAAARALASSGARVQPARPEVSEPAKAFEAASRAGIPTVAFVSGGATSEGKVRGPGMDAANCTLTIRVVTASGGLAVADESESMRSFADGPDRARNDCLQKAAAAIIPRIIPASGARIAPDVRTIVLVAALATPAAVPALVKQIRSIGSVTSAEVRRITSGAVELWVRSRLQATALATALGRDTSGPLVISSPEVTGDLVRVTVAYREPAVPVTPPTSAPAPALSPGTPPPSAQP